MEVLRVYYVCQNVLQGQLAAPPSAPPRLCGRCVLGNSPGAPGSCCPKCHQWPVRGTDLLGYWRIEQTVCVFRLQGQLPDSTPMEQWNHFLRTERFSQQWETALETCHTVNGLQFGPGHSREPPMWLPMAEGRSDFDVNVRTFLDLPAHALTHLSLLNPRGQTFQPRVNRLEMGVPKAQGGPQPWPLPRNPPPPPTTRCPPPQTMTALCLRAMSPIDL